MLGNNTCTIILTSRDRLLLKEIAIGKVIDREQAKRIAGFKSTTRANDRLLKLTRAGLLRRFFIGPITTNSSIRFKRFQRRCPHLVPEQPFARTAIDARAMLPVS